MGPRKELLVKSPTRTALLMVIGWPWMSASVDSGRALMAVIYRAGISPKRVATGVTIATSSG